jgi:hypothetical protein
MIKFKYKFKSEFDKVQKSAEKANIAMLFRISAMIRNNARKITNKDPKEVRPEGEPYRRQSNMLRNDIRFDVNKMRRTGSVGYLRHWKGAELQELGGRRPDPTPGKEGRINIIPARPSLVPSLDMAKKTVQKLWPEYGKVFEG